MGPRGAAYTQCRSNSLGADFAMISNAELDRLIAELGTRPVPKRRATISWCAATVWPASSENTLLPPDTEKPRRIYPVENGAERHVPARHPGRHALPMVRPIPQTMRAESDSDPDRPRDRSSKRGSSEGKRNEKLGEHYRESPIAEREA